MQSVSFFISFQAVVMMYSLEFYLLGRPQLWIIVTLSEPIDHAKGAPTAPLSMRHVPPWPRQSISLPSPSARG
jgi:hypothetical protein